MDDECRINYYFVLPPMTSITIKLTTQIRYLGLVKVVCTIRYVTLSLNFTSNLGVSVPLSTMVRDTGKKWITKIYTIHDLVKNYFLHVNKNNNNRIPEI